MLELDKNFKIPKEDEILKNLVLSMWVEVGRVRLGDQMPVNLDSPEVWDSVTTFAQGIWDSWKDDLEAKGFTKIKFFRFMKYLTDDILLWAYDRISWGELVDRIRKAIEGPIAKDILDANYRTTGRY